LRLIRFDHKPAYEAGFSPRVGGLKRPRHMRFFFSEQNALVYDIVVGSMVFSAILRNRLFEGCAKEMSEILDRPEWDLRLGYLIHDVSRLRRMMFDRALAPLGITRSQWWVLAFISRKDGLPQTQLANELDVGKVAVGALIDRLESSGFVIRQADPVDRRIKRVYVTKQARGFLSRIRKETDKFNATIVNGIDRKQLEAMSDSLLAMKRNLLALSDGTAPAEISELGDAEKKPKRSKRKAAA
jgi:DNA-binding MarR family transcriptional regulator